MSEAVVDQEFIKRCGVAIQILLVWDETPPKDLPIKDYFDILFRHRGNAFHLLFESVPGLFNSVLQM